MMSALTDKFECALFAGLRLSEWAQDARCSDIKNYKLDFKKQARALCLGDIRFEAVSSHSIHGEAVLRSSIR